MEGPWVGDRKEGDVLTAQVPSQPPRLLLSHEELLVPLDQELHHPGLHPDVPERLLAGDGLVLRPEEVGSPDEGEVPTGHAGLVTQLGEEVEVGQQVGESPEAVRGETVDGLPHEVLPPADVRSHSSDEVGIQAVAAQWLWQLSEIQLEILRKSQVKSLSMRLPTLRRDPME